MNDKTSETEQALLQGLAKVNNPAAPSTTDDDELLASYIDGTLNQGERKAFEQRLAHEGSLRLRWVHMRQIQQTQQSSQANRKPNLFKPSFANKQGWIPAAAVAACVLLTANLVFFSDIQDKESIQPGVISSPQLAHLPAPKRLWQVYLSEAEPINQDEENIWQLRRQLSELPASQPCLVPNQNTQQILNTFIGKYPADFSRFKQDESDKMYWCELHQHITAYARRIHNN